MSINPQEIPLCVHVEDAVEKYLARVVGENLNDFYNVVLEQVEVPLFKKVMAHVGNNQSKAAEVLGLSRGTLRKKLKQYSLL
jgi:Fis family transcriptional regulator, factor for inversion stimulation protein